MVKKLFSRKRRKDRKEELFLRKSPACAKCLKTTTNPPRILLGRFAGQHFIFQTTNWTNGFLHKLIVHLKFDLLRQEEFHPTQRLNAQPELRSQPLTRFPQNHYRFHVQSHQTPQCIGEFVTKSCKPTNQPIRQAIYPIKVQGAIYLLQGQIAENEIQQLALLFS